MMAYPHRVKKLVLAALGWYTYPDITVAFPHGIGAIEELPDIHFNLPALLSIPVRVLVWEKDTVRDSTFMKSNLLDHRQGVNRVERAQRWIRQMRAATQAYNLDFRHDFQVLPGADHSFEDCMAKGLGDVVFDSLFVK